jgi:hypothetical protein
MAKVIYNQGNRQESIPFVALLDGIGDLYETLNLLCEDTTDLIPKLANQDKYILIQGKSCFEEIPSFYNKLLWLIKNQWASEKDKIMIVIFFEYFNSGTSKAIIDLLLDVSQTFPHCSIVWLSDIGDEENYEQGQLISQIIEKKNFLIEEVVLM